MSELRALGLCRRCISLYRHARGSGRAVTGQPGSILQNLSQRQAAFILSPVVPLTVSLQAKFDSDSDGSGECHWIGFHSFCPRLRSDCTATDILTLPRLKNEGARVAVLAVPAWIACMYSVCRMVEIGGISISFSACANRYEVFQIVVNSWKNTCVRLYKNIEVGVGG